MDKKLLGYWNSSYIDATGNIYLGGKGGVVVPQAVIIPEPVETVQLEGDWTANQYKAAKNFATTLPPKAVVSSAFTPPAGITIQQMVSISASENIRVWISSTANGTPIAGTDFTYSGNAPYTFTSGLSRPPYPEVATGSTLYLNIANTSRARSTTVQRYSLAKRADFTCPYTQLDSWTNNGVEGLSFTYNFSGAQNELAIRAVDNSASNGFPYYVMYGFGWSECTPTINLQYLSDTPISITSLYSMDTAGEIWGIQQSSTIGFNAPASTLFPTFLRGGVTKRITNVTIVVNNVATTVSYSNNWILDNNRIVIPDNFLVVALKQVYSELTFGNPVSLSLQFGTESV